jgi:hypothetical protein
MPRPGLVARRVVAVGLLGSLFASISAGPAPASLQARFDRSFDARTFQKGNLHTHSRVSDGDSDPRALIAWYRLHGYNFLALTDHNHLSHPARYDDLEDDRFVLLSGEEVSMTGAGRQVHINALCTTREIGGGSFGKAADALVWAVSEIDAQKGVAIVNHPNFDDALSLSDLLAVSTDAPLLEIESGHPYVFSAGRGGRPSHERLWDEALSEGAGFMGVGVDDVHQLARCADPPAYPGRAWVEVFAEDAEPEALCRALRAGALYASTGPSLRRIRVDPSEYAVWPGFDGAEVTFVGREGRILMHMVLGASDAARYVPQARDGYVRAIVGAPDGTKAWTPAVAVVAHAAK